MKTKKKKPTEKAKAKKGKVEEPKAKKKKKLVARPPKSIGERVRNEREDAFDEELESELEDTRLNDLIGDLAPDADQKTVDRHKYFTDLLHLQAELVKLQDWVVDQKLKVVVLFEGRDAAGKGGVIKRIMQRMNPRVCRVVALPAPTAREKTQWYFQRYIEHLPAGGEIVLFDRSWYNRAGVERVMGFCTPTELEEFFRQAPEFERMLVNSGIVLLKYWFSITDDEQHLRFTMRIRDPMKQWKLSPMDLESRRKWELYTKAKEEMLKRTHTPESKWWIVEGDDKKRARLNCLHHLLSQIPYREIPRPPVVLPARVHNPNYFRGAIPDEMYVPEVY